MSFEPRALLGRSQLLLGASVAALVCAAPAYAQDASSPPPPTTDDVIPPTDDQAEANIADQDPPEAAPAQTETGEVIVVTGTRIRQPEFTSPDPVTSIDPEMAQRQGQNDTASMLQSSPVAAGSTQITAAISSNFVTNGGPGAQTIDLRGLGANRTLVLLNGRRAGPAGVRGGVSSFDLNVLPQSIVQRVEILKTGASSIYGSDAIAGVVNLITKTEMNGLQLDANGSVPTRSGGEQFRASALWGKTFERGHVMVAADFFKQNELTRGDRDYLGCPEDYTFRPNSDERADLIDPRTGQYHCNDLRWGHVWTYDLERIFFGAPRGNLFNTEGVYTGRTTLIQFQYPGETLGIPAINPNAGSFGRGLRAPAGWFPTGYNPATLAVQNAYHPFVNEGTLVPDTKLYTLYGDAAFEITDNIELFAEFLGNRRQTYQNGWRQFWTFGYTGEGNFRGRGGTFWAKDWKGWNWLSPTGITDQNDSSQKVDYKRGVGGIRGDFGGFLNGWSFDTHVQYSHNKGVYRDQQILQDIYDISYFQTASCVGTVTPVSNKQCIDLPWLDPFFLAGQMTDQQIDFLFDWEQGRTIYKQLGGEGSVSGNLFNLPGGPVGLALGVTARRDTIHDRPGEITLAGNAWGSTASGITAGRSTTTEAFGELSVPVLRELTMFKDLTLSGAARVTNVKSVQAETGVTDKDTGNWTYKLGGNWAVNDWVRFRGTYGTSFRAPALFEQFKANETSFVNNRNIDPCVNWAQNLERGLISQRIAENCAAAGVPGDYAGGAITATVFSQGGIGILDPETSTAKTASIILTPQLQRFLPSTRLSVAVDYFDIRVKGEISQLGARNIVFGCYGSDFFPNDPLCNLFERGIATDPFAIDNVQDKYINIAEQRNKGIDVTGLLQQGLGRWGSLNFLAQMTWQLKDTFALFEDTETSSNGLIGDPKWVGDFNLTWRPPGGWHIFWGMDVYGKASNMKRFIERNPPPAGSGLPPGCLRSVTRGDYCVDADVPTTFYHSASVTKEFAAPMNLEATLGVANLLDTTPPRVSTIGLSGMPSMIGPVVGTSQYDFMGRRIFLNISKKF